MPTMPPEEDVRTITTESMSLSDVQNHLVGVSSSSAIMEQSLRKTLHDFEIRSQVERCVQDLLQDVEVAERLTERVRESCIVQDLIRQGRSQAWALEEERMLRRQQKVQNQKLADQLVSELWTVSSKLGEFQRLKAAHAELSEEYDSMVAKLLFAQDEIEELREQRNRLSSSTATSTATTGAPAATVSVAKEQPSNTMTVDENDIKKPIAEEDEKAPQPDAVDTAQATTTEVAKPKVDEPIVISEETEWKFKKEETGQAEPVQQEPAPVEQQQQQPQSAAAEVEPPQEPVVSLLLEEEEEDMPTPALYELEASILMHIFGFLDALDILNTAQVNIAMYSTVDSIFGLGGGGGAQDTTTSANSDNSTIATNEGDQASFVAAASPAPASSATTAATSVSSSSAAPAVATTTTATAATSTLSPTIAHPSTVASTTQQPKQPQETRVVIPPLPPATTAAAAVPTGKILPASTAAAATERGGAFFSFLQASRRPAASSSTASAIMTPPSPTTKKSATAASSAASMSFTTGKSPHRRQGSYDPAANAKNAPPMNAAMANSMAAKLSDSELNAIILMTERLKQNENLAERLRQENEKLRASLDGTEAVKQFLINKVREMEESLTRQESNETKVAQQIASDQEVIAFLDARIQTLERDLVVAQEARQAAETEVTRIQEQGSKKASVLQDILQFEREKCAEQEREWRATKKLLVKEVKNCRAQMAKLAAERDGYREQNESLLRFGSSSSASGGGGMSNGRDRSFT